MDANRPTSLPVVLVVDDEPQHLQLASYVLGKEHEVVTALNGEEALKIARSRNIDIALVDYRMPGLRGTDLLQMLGEIVPACVRFLVTAYSDESVLQEAINSASVYRFVTKPVNYASLGADIKRALEHRQALQQAQQSEKMAMAGVLASIAVHDMRNSLQGLSLVPFFLDPATPDNLAQAKATLAWSQQTMANCISEVLTVVKGGTPTYDLVLGSVARVVDSTVQVYRSLYPDRTFVLDMNLELPQIMVSERHVHRMLSNLMGNAAQATQPGGTITIKVGVDGAGHLSVAIQDDGEGMSPAVQQHLFKPMFSTKGAGGVGLGLRLCQSVMDAHGGQLSFVSSQGTGTTFTAQFPLPSP